MRVLIVTQYFEPEVGAPQVRLANFTRELRRNGHDVEIVTAMPNYPRGEIFEGYGGKIVSSEPWPSDPEVVVHRVWMKAGGGRGAARLLAFASFAAMLPIGLRRAQKPDLVVSNSPLLHASPVAIAAARMWGAATALYAADLWPDSMFELIGHKPKGLAPVLLRIEAWIYKRADVVISVTEGIDTTLRDEKKVDPRKITFLPNGVDIDAFSPDIEPKRPAQLVDIDGPLFVFPGTLGYFNGLDIVLDAMEHLAPTRPDIHFAFVGDGPERERLEASARERGLDRVVFTGVVTPGEIASLMPTVRAGVVCLLDLPVTRGARPAKTFPILSSARPVIFVGVGEGPDLIERAGGGISVEPGDGVGLADAMITLADDQELADSLGASGREYVAEHLSWRGLVAGWLTDLGGTSSRMAKILGSSSTSPTLDDAEPIG